MYRGFMVGVVVPAYNEERLIEKTLDSMPDFVDRVYVVNDASTDSTRDSALKSGERLGGRLVLIDHESNKGVGAAITSGYRKALEDGCQVTAVMAGDAQMDPIQLPRLLDPIVEGRADYMKGNRLISRENRARMPALRVLGNSMLTFLTKISSGYWDLVDPQNGYSAISDNALKYIDLDSLYPRYGFPNDLLVKLNVYNFRVKDVIMPAVYGSEKSKIVLWKYIPSVSWLLVKGFFWRMREKYVIQAFHPLVFFYFMGFTLLPLGVISAAYMLYLRVSTGGITASSVLIPMFLLITGLQSLFSAMLFDMESNKRY